MRSLLKLFHCIVSNHLVLLRVIQLTCYYCDVVLMRHDHCSRPFVSFLDDDVDPYSEGVQSFPFFHFKLLPKASVDDFSSKAFMTSLSTALMLVSRARHQLCRGFQQDFFREWDCNVVELIILLVVYVIQPWQPAKNLSKALFDLEAIHAWWFWAEGAPFG